METQPQILLFLFLCLWNLFPNGLMLVATWWSSHDQLLDEQVDEGEFSFGSSAR